MRVYSVFSGRCYVFLLVVVVGTIQIISAQTTPLSVAGDDLVYNSANSDTVQNGPMVIPSFTLTSPTYITEIADDHFNGGSGAIPGTIGLYCNSNSTLVGTWTAVSGTTSTFGIPTNQWWLASPGVMLPAGNYSIVDSDVSSWSYSTTNNLSANGVGPDWAPNIGMAQVAIAPQNFIYNTNTDGTLNIRGYVGSNTVLNIPETLLVNGVNVSVTTIAAYAFHGMGVTSVTIPDTITSIGDDAFTGCSDLTSVTIGDNVTYIGAEAFLNCVSLTSVTIPDSANLMGESAFSGSGLTSVNIPANLIQIGLAAFLACPNLTAINVDPNNPAYSSISGVWFDKSQAYLIQYPTALGGNYAIPSSVTNIDIYAFNGSNLTNVTIPNNVISIGDYAFASTNLTTATIPNNVTSIGNFAFQDCSNLTSISIPASATSIGALPFSGCSNLTAINVDPGNPAYSSVDGVFIQLGHTTRLQNFPATLIQYPPNKAGSSYTIPSSVASIGTQAFAGANLTSVTISPNVYSIGDYAFTGANLTSVTIPDTVASIGDGAFFNCANLASATIPNSITSIGTYMFMQTGLTSITIPANITSIGYQAFAGCDNITGVFFTGNAPTVDPDAFDSDNNPTVYYLAGTTGWASTFAGLPTVAISQAKFTWLQDNFTSVQLGNPSISNDIAEPAGDGIPNLLKYAFSLPALVNGQASLPQPIVSNGNLVLTFSAVQSDLAYTVEASTDLADWSTTGVTVQTNGSQVTASYPLPANGSACLRVVVSPAP